MHTSSAPSHVEEPQPQGFIGFALGGGLLACCSGLTNVQTVLDVGLPTTHMTGNLTQLSLAIVEPSARGLLVLAVLIAFVLGAAIAGATVESTELAPGRTYGVLLVLAGVVLAVGTGLMVGGYIALGAGAIALASGAQNGLATRFSSAIVRTTHMTGIVTDLGIALGKALSRRGVARWRVILHLTLVAGFLAGGVAGVFVQHELSMLGLLLPAGMLVVLGIGYSVWQPQSATTS